MSGMGYGLGGIVIGTMIDNYRRDLQEDVMYYHPFNWFSVLGGVLGICHKNMTQLLQLQESHKKEHATYLPPE